MRSPRPTAHNLADLEIRLRGGICESARPSLPEDWARYEDEALHRNWPASAFAALGTFRSADREPAAVSLLASELADSRNLLLVVLFSADRVLQHLRDLRRDADADFPEADSWVGLLWLSIAAWRVVGEGQSPRGAGFSVLDDDLLRPLAARLLFLVASEPMRSRQQAESAWWGRAEVELSESGIAGVALGPKSWHQLVGVCQLARRNWLRCLGAYESHPYLALAQPAELEEELRTLVFCDGRRGAGRRGAPLALSAAYLDSAASLTEEDKAVIGEVTDQYFLPRFDLRSVIRLATHDDDRAARRWRRIVGIVSLAAAIAVLGCTIFLRIHQAAAVAAGYFLLVGFGIAVFGRGWSAPWLLRFPAAAAVGVIALISLSPGDWVTGPPGGWQAAVVLDTAAFGYLIVEARNHGVSGGALLLRSLGVASIGAMYGLMVALIGLVFVAPVFTQNGRSITALWTCPSYSHAGLALWLAASWCLAIGVFSQILWDDRPITAPLAHLSWQRR